MAQGNGNAERGRQIMALAGTVKYILRAAPQPEAVLNTSGTATKAGFYVSHNPSQETSAVFVEALGYGNRERTMLDRYKTALGRALQSALSVDPEAHLTIVTTGEGGMLRLSGLTGGQIERLQQRYSAR